MWYLIAGGLPLNSSHVLSSSSSVFSERTQAAAQAPKAAAIDAEYIVRSPRMICSTKGMPFVLSSLS